MVHIRAYVHRANTTTAFQPLPADRLSAHVERVRANSSGGVWALIDETFSVVLNYPQHVGGTTGEFPQVVDAAVQLLSQMERADGGETVADLRVRHSQLRSIDSLVGTRV